jgi:hypothetical protein
MLAAHTSDGASRPWRSPVLRFPQTRAQAAHGVQLRDESEWLRARKSAARLAFGFRAGGAPLKQIAGALCVTQKRASELLDLDSNRKLSDEYVDRLDGTEFAHVAAAVRAVRLGLPLAGEGRRAA